MLAPFLPLPHTKKNSRKAVALAVRIRECNVKTKLDTESESIKHSWKISPTHLGLSASIPNPLPLLIPFSHPQARKGLWTLHQMLYENGSRLEHFPNRKFPPLSMGEIVSKKTTQNFPQKTISIVLRSRLEFAQLHQLIGKFMPPAAMENCAFLFEKVVIKKPIFK